MNKIIIPILLCVLISNSNILDRLNFGLTYQFYLDPFSPNFKNSQHQAGIISKFGISKNNAYLCLEAGTNSWLITNYDNEYGQTQYAGPAYLQVDSLYLHKPLFYKANSNGIYLNPFLMVCYGNLFVTAGGQFDIGYHSYSYSDSVKTIYNNSNQFVNSNQYRIYGNGNYWRTLSSFRYSIGYRINRFEISLVSYDLLKRMGLSICLLLKPI
jgi:hypothetical protein